MSAREYTENGERRELLRMAAIIRRADRRRRQRVEQLALGLGDMRETLTSQQKGEPKP